MIGDELVLEMVEDAAERARGIPGADTLASIFVPALISEVRRLQAQLEPISEAWNNSGPQPSYHRKAQAALRRDWPTLARAVERLKA